MSVVIDEEQRERVVIFGGITDQNERGLAGLSNQVFTLEFLQIN